MKARRLATKCNQNAAEKQPSISRSDIRLNGRLRPPLLPALVRSSIGVRAWRQIQKPERALPFPSHAGLSATSQDTVLDALQRPLEGMVSAPVAPPGATPTAPHRSVFLRRAHGQTSSGP